MTSTKKPIIPCQWVGKGSPLLPSQQSDQAAGYDLRANIPDVWYLEPHTHMAVPTGLALAIPDGYEGQVRPRSGLAFHHGVTVLNSPGTIDADYRGEIKVLLINLGQTTFAIQPQARIAQLIIAPVVQVDWKFVKELPETTRGKGGFGSTGHT